MIVYLEVIIPYFCTVYPSLPTFPSVPPSTWLVSSLLAILVHLALYCPLAQVLLGVGEGRIDWGRAESKQRISYTLHGQGGCLDLPEPHFLHLSSRDNISYLTTLSREIQGNICNLCSSLHNRLSINLTSSPLSFSPF